MASIVVVNILALLLETLLFGVFVLLFVASTYFFLRKRPGAVPGGRGGRLYSLPTLWLSALMFVLVTTHWSVNVGMSFQAFVFFHGGSAPGDYFNDTTQILSILKYTILMVLLVVGDISIIYRLWVTWVNRTKYVMIPPITLFTGFVVSAVGFIHAYLGSHWQAGQPLDLFAKAVGGWIIGLCICTASTSLYCNAMISWVVWKVERAGKSLGTRRLATFRAITIESAILYTCWGSFYFMAWKIDSSISSIASDTLAQVTGITFMLINVRMGLISWQTDRDDV
ncbi:hypothetical protein BD779DRAFT_1536990 [Infundibulicybe gibba]|nr:hypothetical protein BD779DRAFT_1536990 [Infundibulicybe gibba]